MQFDVAIVLATTPLTWKNLGKTSEKIFGQSFVHLPKLFLSPSVMQFDVVIVLLFVLWFGPYAADL